MDVELRRGFPEKCLYFDGLAYYTRLITSGQISSSVCGDRPYCAEVRDDSLVISLCLVVCMKVMGSTGKGLKSKNYDYETEAFDY